MPRIPQLGQGPSTAGDTVNPLNSNVPTAQANLSALGAVNRANAEMGEAFSQLGQKLFNKSKNLQIEEETSQARADYETEVRERTIQLNEEYNSNKDADFKNYKDDYEVMLLEIEEDYEDEDRFGFSESKSAFNSFRESFNTRVKAQADVHQIKNVTESLIRNKDNQWQTKMRGVEARPIPYEASSILTQDLASFELMNRETGKLSPEQMDRKSRSYHKNALDSLMTGYMSSGAVGEGINFLSNKNDPHYKNITKKVDGTVIAGWESRLQAKIKADGEITKREVNSDFRNFMTAAASGTISGAGEQDIEILRDRIESGDFDAKEKAQLLDRLGGMKSANEKFKEITTMSLADKNKILNEIATGTFKFFPKAKGEFNAAARAQDEKFYTAQLQKDIKEMQTNTGEYLAKNNEEIGMLAQRASMLDNPNAVKAYIEKTKTHMNQLGVSYGKVLTGAMSSQVASSFNNTNVNDGASQIGVYRQSFDEHSGVIYADMQGKVPNSKLIALTMQDDTSRAVVLRNQRDAKLIKEELGKNTGFDMKMVSASSGVRELEGFKQKGDRFGSAARLWKPIIENVELETARILASGEQSSLSDASEQAKKNIFDANYASLDGILIPGEYNVSVDDMQDFMDDFEELNEQIVDRKVNRGFNMENVKWFNDPSGITLRAVNNVGRPSAPIIGKNGEPVRIDFKNVSDKSYIGRLRDMAQIKKDKSTKMFNKKTKKELPNTNVGVPSGRNF